MNSLPSATRKRGRKSKKTDYRSAVLHVRIQQSILDDLNLLIRENKEQLVYISQADVIEKALRYYMMNL